MTRYQLPKVVGVLAISLFIAACDAAPRGDSAQPSAGKTEDVGVDIAYEKFTLDNGLRVIVHEDHKAPIVAVNVWYHVGSKDEPDGRSGFAHLFEHLMFNGTENYDDEYFGPFEQVGATGMNGTTNLDRTNYFETVPTPALDMALWMESDRMGHLLGAITQEKLDEQRGVVQNEKRQGENSPYGRVYEFLLKGLYPVGHPYSHTVIGSMEDLNAASLDDVHQWFKDYYGASNAVLVIAGDTTVADARALAEKYFGDIAPGPQVQKKKSMVPVRKANTTESMHDQVPQRAIFRAWSVPGRATYDESMLDIAASILGDGKNSRLNQELVFKAPHASSASAFVAGGELASIFGVQVLLQPDADYDEVVGIIDNVMADFIANGPTAEEVQRVKTGQVAAAIRGLERIGGFTGKANILATGEVFAGNPDHYKTSLAWTNGATSESVRQVAANWLSEGYHQLTVLPNKPYAAAGEGVDRSTGLPTVGAMPDLSFPAIERATLSNGIDVVLRAVDSVPIVNMAVQFDAGYAADSGRPAGTASFTMNMLDEGTSSRDALTIASQAEMLGASISTGSNLDMSTVQLSALKSNLSASMDLFADVVRNANFPEGDIERIRPQMLAAIEQEKSNPVNLGLRNLPPLLFGEGHAYGVSFSGSGTADSIGAISRDDMVGFRDSWLRADNASILVVGDTTLAEITAELEKAFGDWQVPATALPTKNLAEVTMPEGRRVIIMDKPDSPQTLILGGHVIPSAGDERNLLIGAANEVLGGSFTARVNMNLREDKGWSYGARTIAIDARGQGIYLVYAPVQSDKTVDSLQELDKELYGYLGDNPATAEELGKVVANNVNSLPGAFETGSAVLGNMMSNARFGRADDYVTTLAGRYQGMSLDEVHQVAGQVMHPGQLVWLLVGDKDQIAEGVREWADGVEVEIWDKDGNPIE